MPLSSAFSVASFSIVLAESFAAIGLSTIIPNATAVALSGVIRAAASTGTTTSPSPQSRLDDVLSFASQDAAKNGGSAKKGVADVLKSFAESVSEGITANPNPAITLLVPTKATLDASFSFHANESFEVNASAGGMIELVTVQAGFSALYKEESSNSVTIHVEFSPVEFKL